jgi:hypothetical protein
LAVTLGIVTVDESVAVVVDCVTAGFERAWEGISIGVVTIRAARGCGDSIAVGIDHTIRVIAIRSGVAVIVKAVLAGQAWHLCDGRSSAVLGAATLRLQRVAGSVVAAAALAVAVRRDRATVEIHAIDVAIAIIVDPIGAVDL